MSEQPSTAQPTHDNPATGESEQADSQPKPTETVEFWKQKAREQEKRAKENATAAQRLAELEARNLSDVERANKAAADAQARADAVERNALRQKVAHEKGLKPNWVNRLSGDTEEELAADADAILAELSAPTSPKPDLSQGARTGTNPSSPADEFAAFIRRGEG